MWIHYGRYIHKVCLKCFRSVMMRPVVLKAAAGDPEEFGQFDWMVPSGHLLQRKIPSKLKLKPSTDKDWAWIWDKEGVRPGFEEASRQ